MAAVKASDKQKVTKKIVAILKEHYKGNVPKVDRPVLETILYGICIENCTVEEADSVYEKLFDSFYDLNEARVSSMFEITTVFEGLKSPEWKAMRVRKTLQYVFETYYSYDLELLKRKTLDLAQKHLKRIKALSPFARNYALQESLGSHLIPVDEKMKNASIFLGLADADMKEDQASAAIKPAVRKSDVSAFAYYLRCLATDPKLIHAFEPEDGHPEEGYDVLDSPSRLEAILKNPPKPKRKRKVTKKKAVTKKKTAKKAVTKKKPAAQKKTTTKKAASEKPASKKSAPTKKKTAKKKTVKKAVKKKVAKKTASATKKKATPKKKAASKKTASKKTVKKKTTKKKSKK